MKCTTVITALLTVAAISACSPQDKVQTSDFEKQVEDYIRKFPYQDTHNYVSALTQGDPANFNTWIESPEPTLVKAGDDKIVRTNNDTFYNMAFVILENGPAVLRSSAPSEDRFNSFQLMDDRNVNYRNVIFPKGAYTLYRGEKPEEVQGEAIEVPSNLSVVIVRVEVKDKNNPEDLAAAAAVFKGITIDGPEVEEAPELDLLSGFDKAVEEESLRRMEETLTTVPYRETVVGPGKKPGTDVPYLYHAAGTKGGWGGPDPTHSAYEALFTDDAGETLNGANGTYTINTEEPPVNAFWSVTVYDTKRGGFFHPNKDDRYHINNTGAVKNADGTVTFTFKQMCEEADLNCLEVPAGPFDLTIRYYLPSEEIISGEWTFPRPKLQEE